MLTSVAVRTGGLGSSTYNGISTLQPYYLHIYSISGSTATLVQTYMSGNITFSDGDWLKWTGFSVRLSANATYAYSFRQSQFNHRLGADGGGDERLERGRNRAHSHRRRHHHHRQQPQV